VQNETIKTQMTYQHFLLSEFESRKIRNSSCFLRAYARDLGLAAPKLSEILRGKCGLSEKSAQLITKKLNLSNEETQLFINLVNAKHARSHA
jgi:plasmid maintenance system antidote protein VapI